MWHFLSWFYTSDIWEVRERQEGTCLKQGGAFVRGQRDEVAVPEVLLLLGELDVVDDVRADRSEERRVGKEC